MIRFAVSKHSKEYGINLKYKILMNYQWKVHHLIAEINKCFGIQASFLITYRAIQLVASLYAFIRYTFQKDLYPSTGAKLCSKFIWFTVRVNQLMVLVYPCECVLEEFHKGLRLMRCNIHGVQKITLRNKDVIYSLSDYH
uniref:Gustatory receptor n=1 Tax=Rhodnius prolixus TaxID=13249 RepID=T1HL78_RHOPR